MNELTVFIGRFSPFHNGHADVLSRALSRSKRVLVLIGSSFSARNIKNPFTYQERERMIRDWYVEEFDFDSTRLIIQPLTDHPYNDQEWIAQVQSIVLQYAGLTKPILTGANRDESTWYLKAFGDFFELDLLQESKTGLDFSATSVREMLFGRSIVHASKLPRTTEEILNKFLKSDEYYELVDEYQFIQRYKESWSKAPYAPTFVTVDAVVVQSGHLLVVQRDAQPGKGLLALPGGFVEQNERLQDACVRELLEETRIELSKAQLHGSITDREVFDHPGRSLRGRTITHAYIFRLKDTLGLPKVKPQAGEVRKVEWMPIAEAKIQPENWYEDHYAIFTHMLGRK